MAHETPFYKFRDGYVRSGFSSNPVKLILVFWKLLSFQYPTTLSSEINCEHQWIQATRFMTSHHRLPWKKKSCVFQWSQRWTAVQLLSWKKTLLLFVSMVWLHVYRDYRGFRKQPSWSYLPRNLFILINLGTGKTLMLIGGCWSDTCNLIANYL